MRLRLGPHVQGTAFTVLAERFPPVLDPAARPLTERFARGEIVRADGSPWTADDPARTGDELWFHRELRPEPRADQPELPILLHDEHLLVIDKPHGVATMPRGEHVLRSALVRLRQSTGLEDLAPIHRLDRPTAGVLAFSCRREERSAYQDLFAQRRVRKVYRAVVVADETLPLGADMLLEDRLVKDRSVLQARVETGAPNARTRLRVVAVGDGRAEVELVPQTGRTHQLRLQLASRGWGIVGDPLYPQVRDAEAVLAAEGPLRLLAAELAFTDPITGEPRDLASPRSLEP
ncbi:23S rRNA pseudouridylate synthase [Brachybacterium sp. EF45031]|nr:23S rRNA pseudouridylate synthase [Brachybacterium sillae]